MTDWSAVFLGVIAVSTLTMALIQVGLIIGAARAGKRAGEAFERIEAALQPLLTRTEGLADNASRLVTRVGASMDRADHLLDAVETQVGRASHAVEEGVKVPAREATAMLAGVQAAVTAVRRGFRSAPRADIRRWPAAINGREEPDDTSGGEMSLGG
jgi:hypothetical protein